MPKIKASELLKDISYNVQKQFLNEDVKYQARIVQILDKYGYKNPTDPVTHVEMTEVIKLHEEFLRFSLIKSFIRTLIEHDLIESDITLDDDTFIDDVILKQTEKAIQETTGIKKE